MTSAVRSPPADLSALRAVIKERFPALSDRLQRIARHVLDEPHDIAFETLAVIAERGGAQPSAIVRFAQAFGFDGATQMQKLVREGLLSDDRQIGYAERIRQFRNGVEVGADDARHLLSDFVEGSMLALENLYHTTAAEDLEQAIDLMMAARTIFVAGFRRAFPPVSLLAYLLSQGEKAAILMDGVAGLHMQQTAAIRSDDLLIATSFAPYSGEAVNVAKAAHARGCGVIAITDSVLAPIAEGAAKTFVVKEIEVHGFRSMSATTCLVQSLAIGCAARAAKASDTA